MNTDPPTARTEEAPQVTPQGRPGGRPAVGPLLKATVPPWIMGQLEALTANRSAIAQAEDPKAPPVPRADVVRDVLRAGLVSLSEKGVACDGFHPGRAMLEAQARGEPI